MKPFTKRLALVMGLLLTALICMGIVYIDNVKHYLSYLNGSVQLVVNTNTVMTVNSNTLQSAFLTALSAQARTGTTNAPFAVRNTNDAATLFLVQSNGGFGSISADGSGGAFNIADGGAVNARFVTSTNCTPNGSLGGSVNGIFTSSTNCSPNGSSGGSVNALFSSSTNCSPNGSSGGSVNARIANGMNCSPNGSLGGFVSTLITGSTNCSPNGSSGGLVMARILDSTSCSPNGASAGVMVVDFSASINCSPVSGSGGFIGGRFERVTNSTFSAVGSRIFATLDTVVSNLWTSLRGGTIFGTATNSTNIVLHSSDGSLISGRFFDNTNLRATNGAAILGQPPAGTTNSADGNTLIYGDVSIMAKGLSIGTNGANATFVTNIIGASATLDFPSTAAGTFNELTISVPTVTSNNVAVSLSVPWQSAQTGGAFVTFNSNDVIYVRFINNQLVTAIDPAPGTFSVVGFRIR